MSVSTGRPADEVEDWTYLRLFEFVRYFSKIPPLHVTAARLAAYMGVKPPGADDRIGDMDETDAAMTEVFGSPT
jgi:hypothetical protein